jgi:predicted nuclease of predicted toxin-antitoxin system
VRFLVDAQLPPSLAAFLLANGHEAVHLFDVAPPDADDAVIWQLALDQSRVIVTKDEDFAFRAKLTPAGPQILWLRVGNCSKAELRSWLQPLLPAIIRALDEGNRLVIAAR